MAVPVSQALTVATYVLKQKIKGRKKYPLVLMLEPLFRCNLACAGCGKIQYPAHILKAELSPEECFKAVEECGTPMVAIPGGEPLLHPQMPEIVAGLVARKKYVYMCTNALLLKEKLHLFTPSKYLSFSVHVDGQREHHDFSVCREGGYDIAMEGVRAAVAAGFRVTTNTTLFDGADPNSVRRALRRADDRRRREHDGVARVHVRQGSRPEALPGAGAVEEAVPVDPVEPQEDLALQCVAHVHGVPDGQEEPDLHAVGHADVLDLRLAEALLPAAGWLRGHLPGVDGDGRVAELWDGVAAIRDARTAWCIRAMRRAV